MMRGVVLALSLLFYGAPSLTSAAPPLTSPWFLHGTKAKEQKRERGWSVQLQLNGRWAPVSTLSAFAQGSVNLIFSEKHMRLHGFVDALAFDVVPYDSFRYYVFERPRGRILFDQGSQVSFHYTWKKAGSHGWGQGLRLFYIPFSDHTLVMGDDVSLLWYPWPGAFGNNPPATYGTIGVGLEWDWMSCGASLSLYPQPKWNNETHKQVREFATSLRGTCEIAPNASFWLRVQGALDQQPSNETVVESTRWSGGIHLTATYRFGKEPNRPIFLYWRLRDPRTAQRGLPRLNAPKGTGVVIRAEGGVQPQEDWKDSQWHYAWALAGRVIGQHSWFQWEAMVSFRNMRWLQTNGTRKAFTDNAIDKARGLTVLGLAIQFQPQPIWAVGVRVDLRFPGLVAQGYNQGEARGFYVADDRSALVWVREDIEKGGVWVSALNLRLAPFAGLDFICEGMVRYDPNNMTKLPDISQRQQKQEPKWSGQVSLLIQAQF